MFMFTKRILLKKSTFNENPVLFMNGRGFERGIFKNTEVLKKHGIFKNTEFLKKHGSFEKSTEF